MNKITVDISGMHCRSCELLTEEELSAIAGVKKVKTNFRTGCAEIFYQERKPSNHAIEQAIRKAGYTVGKEKRKWIISDISAWVEMLFAICFVLILYFLAKTLGLFEISLGASEQFTSLPFVLLFGLVAGFSTCMAMVGGLVFAMSARFSEQHPKASTREKFLPNVYFNMGRVGGFAVLGGLLGRIGETFQFSSFVVGWMTLFIGGVMLLVGLQLVELFPRLSMWKLQLPKSIARILVIQSQTKKEYSHTRVMMLGMLTFFLPCGFTQLVQLFVVTQGSVLGGAITMGVFALGTAPGLLGIGGIATSVQGTFRNFFFKFAGVIVIALGIFNFQNGSVLVRLGTESQGKVESSEKGIVTNQEAQVIRIVQDASGYTPKQLTVKKGIPVKLIIESKDSYTCATSFMMPKAGIQKTLKPGENVFEFMPKESGTLPFSCSMGMYRGVINVTE